MLQNAHGCRERARAISNLLCLAALYWQNELIHLWKK